MPKASSRRAIRRTNNAVPGYGHKLAKIQGATTRRTRRSAGSGNSCDDNDDIVFIKEITAASLQEEIVSSSRAEPQAEWTGHEGGIELRPIINDDGDSENEGDEKGDYDDDSDAGKAYRSETKNNCYQLRSLLDHSFGKSHTINEQSPSSSSVFNEQNQRRHKSLQQPRIWDQESSEEEDWDRGEQKEDRSSSRSKPGLPTNKKAVEEEHKSSKE